MKSWIIPIFATTTIICSSCDYTMYVAVRNYQTPCRVNVQYQEGVFLHDSDTLLTKEMDARQFNNSVIRVNTSPGSYFFFAPVQKEIALNPVSLGTPIKRVEIEGPDGAVWSIDLRDWKGLKKLKRSGRVSTKGFVFTNSIFIENR